MTEEEGSSDICKQRSYKWNALRWSCLCGNANCTYVITK